MENSISLSGSQEVGGKHVPEAFVERKTAALDSPRHPEISHEHTREAGWVWTFRGGPRQKIRRCNWVWQAGNVAVREEKPPRRAGRAEMVAGWKDVAEGSSRPTGVTLPASEMQWPNLINVMNGAAWFDENIINHLTHCSRWGSFCNRGSAVWWQLVPCDHW